MATVWFSLCMHTESSSVWHCGGLHKGALCNSAATTSTAAGYEEEGGVLVRLDKERRDWRADPAAR